MMGWHNWNNNKKDMVRFERYEFKKMYMLHIDNFYIQNLGEEMDLIFQNSKNYDELDGLLNFHSDKVGCKWNKCFYLSGYKDYNAI